MLATPTALSVQRHVLIVDDEPDVHALTRLSLKGFQHRGQPLELLSAHSAKQALDMLKSNAGIAVILLDVVMENDAAGLDACRVIRGELNNPLVRILLRTGQPGAAPERQTIDSYDIDGYLPKSELTSHRLYTAVRTALRAWEELVELERHRRVLSVIHEATVGLHAYTLPETMLAQVLRAAVTVCPTTLAVLRLETFSGTGDPRRYSLHQSTDTDTLRAELAATDAVARIARDPLLRASTAVTALDDGVLVPLHLHHDLGGGWIYLQGTRPDALTSQALGLLAAHAANALYASVAQALLAARVDAPYDALAI